MCYVFLLPTGDLFSGINADLVGPSSPRGDLSEVLIRQNDISAVLVWVRVIA